MGIDERIESAPRGRVPAAGLPLADAWPQRYGPRSYEHLEYPGQSLALFSVVWFGVLERDVAPLGRVGRVGAHIKRLGVQSRQAIWFLGRPYSHATRSRDRASRPRVEVPRLRTGAVCVSVCARSAMRAPQALSRCRVCVRSETELHLRTVAPST